MGILGQPVDQTLMINLVQLPDDYVFTYGSNEIAFHGSGAARTALEKYGAIMYSPNPYEGRSYGIATKDRDIRTLSLPDIYKHIFKFLGFAKSTGLTFKITRIGCGLANLKDRDIAPMFKLGMDHHNYKPANLVYDTKWHPWLGDKVGYWGTF